MRLAFAVAMMMATSGAATAASFDCGKAETVDERTVCGDRLLSELDSLLAKAHEEARKAEVADDVRQVARDFLADRRTCKADKTCILGAYVGVLNDLEMRGAQNHRPEELTAETMADGRADAGGALPTEVGACAATEVDSVHPRLGDGSGNFTDADFDSGTGIDYANGGYQVSYEREEALIASKPGDAITMCLISIPHRCPEGDDRGRVYLVTNARTHGTWALADSQHMCGGA